MAPNRSSIQPDLLGFGTIRCQATGFVKIILVEAAAFIKVFEDNANLRNGVAGRVNLSSIQSMVKSLTAEQATEVTVKMPDKTIFQCTMGDATILVTPPGSRM